MKEQALIVEIGNSVSDFAVFDGGIVLAAYTAPTDKLAESNAGYEQVEKILHDHPSISHAAVCSVVPSVGDHFLHILSSALSGRVLEINSSLSLPFILDYKPPHALGADRLALCALSRSNWRDQAVIALDVGTAITFDVLNSGGNYLGGMILPGLDLMTAVLHDRTAKLPQVQITSSSMPLLGRSTADCIQSGVLWGCVKQVEGLLADIRCFLGKELGERGIRVIATGGSSRLVASAMAEPPLIDEQAVLKGAKVLLDLNIQHAQ